MQHEAQALHAAAHRLLEAVERSKHGRDRAKIERKLERAVAKIFRAQGKAFLAEFKKLESQFEEAVRKRDIDSAWKRAASKTLTAFTGAIDSALGTAVLKGAQAVIATAKAGIGFDLKNPRAVAYLKDRAADRVAKIDETTRDTIKGLIVRGQEDGLGYNEIARSISDRFEEFAVGRPQDHIDSRAHLVAVTEVGTAYCDANLMAAAELQDFGIEMEKSWLAEATPCDECADNAGAGWIPIEEEFPSGDQAPLAHPACLCDLLTRRKGSGD